MDEGLDALCEYRLLVANYEDKWSKNTTEHFIECADIIEKELKEYQEIKTYLQDYEINGIEELRRVLHNDWVIRKKFDTDASFISKTLAIIKKKISDINWFKCCNSLDDYNNSVPSYRHLTQEEWDLVRKVLL